MDAIHKELSEWFQYFSSPGIVTFVNLKHLLKAISVLREAGKETDSRQEQLSKPYKNSSEFGNVTDFRVEQLSILIIWKFHTFSSFR